MLFVLVGAAVDIRYTLTAGAAAVLLYFRSAYFQSRGRMDMSSRHEADP